MSANPKFRVKVGEPIGTELFFSFPEIFDNEKSFFDADAAVGATTLTASGTNFAANQYIVLGQPGSEKTEIVLVSGVTATTISVSATVFPHNRGDLIQFIPYNQIVPERSTDSGSTFSALSAIGIRADAPETYLQRTADSSTDVYRFRFYNSTSTLYGGYSSSGTASGFADNSVYSIFNRALDDIGEKWSDLITREFMITALAEGRRVVDQDPRIFRWSFRTKFDTDIGNVIPGRWLVAAPTDLRDRNTNKNILSLRIGRQNRPLVYQDKNRFNQNYLNIAHTTLDGAVLSGATSITLTSSGDFDESGNIVIAAESVSETRDAVAYTANNETTNVLSGVTGVGVNHATGRDVWQQANFGLPMAYTIVDGVIYFDLPFDDQYAGENIYSDYYKSLTAVSADSDLLDEPFYDLYIPWLRWKIKYKKANGKIDAETDTDYKEFMKGVNQLISQETIGQSVDFIPNVNGWLGPRY